MAVVRRRGRTELVGWSWRLFGLVICAFFALGVAAGLGASARGLAVKVRGRLDPYQWRLPPLFSPERGPVRIAYEPSESSFPAEALMMVERHDGFYALYPDGALRGPLSPSAEGDLPVLSGPGLDGARAQDLIDYAERLVRAEVALSAMVSEMRVMDDGTISLFLETPRVELILDRADWAAEIQHAAQLLKNWQDRPDVIAQLDLTTPGQAVMRLGSEPANLLSLNRKAPKMELSLVRGTAPSRKKSARR